MSADVLSSGPAETCRLTRRSPARTLETTLRTASTARGEGDNETRNSKLSYFA